MTYSMTPKNFRRAAVAGGAGFIGSLLCETLLSVGVDVICIDNLVTGSLGNISDLHRHTNFEFRHHDVIDPILIDVDAIFNLACPASPTHYQRDPIKTLKTNVQGSINLLDVARETGARILQASTSEIYGDPLEHPQAESYWGNVNPIGPRASYDEGKRCAETLFFEYHRQYGVKAKVVRIFNTYGPRMSRDDGRVIPKFIRQALNGETITIYGDGSQTRSFCYVDDLVQGLIRMMDSDDDLIGPINLGNPSELTISALAGRIIELAGSRSRIAFSPLPTDDPRRRRPDIGAALRELGWSPSVGLNEGLRRTIACFAAEPAALLEA